MYCPSCGNQSPNDQKFCRSCGMNLQRVTPALIEHLAETGSGQPQIERSAEFQQLSLRKVLVGTTILFIGMIVGIIGKMMIHNGLVAGVGALVSILGMFWMVFSLLYAGSKLKSASHHVHPAAGELDAKTTSQLPPERVQNLIPSVTERTTDLLVDTASQPAEAMRRDELKA